jgi:hypothetical protein
LLNEFHTLKVRKQTFFESSTNFDLQNVMRQLADPTDIIVGISTCCSPHHLDAYTLSSSTPMPRPLAILQPAAPYGSRTLAAAATLGSYASGEAIQDETIDEVVLSQNYPNPFASGTNIEVNIPHS